MARSALRTAGMPPPPLPGSVLVLVEPSCGDGRVLERMGDEVRALLLRGRGEEILARGGGRRCVLLGYDVDGEAVEECRRRVRGGQEQGRGRGRGAEGGPAVAVRRADFLSLTREELVRDARDAAAAVVDEASLRFVFFGGPPYSSGQGGRGGEAGRGLDLPDRFVRRCLEELGGHGASFLLPERCARSAGGLREVLNGTGGGSARGEGGSWNYETAQLEESSFDFCGRTVPQPSVLQAWYWDAGEGGGGGARRGGRTG